MKKKIFCGILVLCMLLLCGCEGGNPTLDISEGFTSDTVVSKPEVFEVNPLTGVEELKENQVNLRPVAVMINNMSGIEKVQTAVTKADIIYETEVEGGITRMMAVFKDISKIGQVGCIRSARYAYVDLAAGHDALYVHCGLDKTYCQAHFNELNSDHVDLNTGVGGRYGFRQSNGLAYEHTMYTSGEKLVAAQSEMGRRTTTTKNSWISFAPYDKEASVVASTTAQKVHIRFSGSASNAFTYNETTGRYERTKNGEFLTDYKTGERVSVKNIFVLKTTMSYYSNGHHRNIALTGGSGYYIVNGKYEEIQWTKGAVNDSIKITKADGSAFTAQPGNSWVCIANTATAKVTFTAAPVPETSSATSTPSVAG